MAAVTNRKRKREVTLPNKAVQFKKKFIKPLTEEEARFLAASPKRLSDPKSKRELDGTLEEPVIADVEEDETIHIQVVTGSYDRVLHGFSASIPFDRLQRSITSTNTEVETTSEVRDDIITFSDAFLLAGHSSSLRCLAVSPPTENDKRILATGSSDERINVYSVSTAPPQAGRAKTIPTLAGTSVIENLRNRSLGSLVHHDRAITNLQFATKSKLFSSAEDNTIAISRTRDWTMLSSIKAPIPKPQGRPSGDTAAPGETPAGVNDFSIHPSQKLMLSVGRGERCMRLWNLMTGKKAGVLNFERALLMQVGESKHSSGEGRTVLWDESGEKYVVGFERGAVVFGINSKPKAILRPSPPTKLHRMHFLPQSHTSGQSILAISTEDGRVLFFNMTDNEAITDAESLPLYECIAQLGGPASGITGRLKDFTFVEVSRGKTPILILITASSDGAIRLWRLSIQDFALESPRDEDVGSDGAQQSKQIGDLLAIRETGNRITCLGAYVLDGKANGEDVDGDIGDMENGQLEDGGASDDSD